MTEAISELSMIAASESDLDALARMNADLIADERGANPMTLDQLRDRFVDWMALASHPLPSAPPCLPSRSNYPDRSWDVLE